MKRRSFLKSIFAALVSVSLARQLTAAIPDSAANEPYPPKDYRNVDLNGMAPRFIIQDGKAVPVTYYAISNSGIVFPNPEYDCAPLEVELWSKDKEYLCIMIHREGGEIAQLCDIPMEFDQV